MPVQLVHVEYIKISYASPRGLPELRSLFVPKPDCSAAIYMCARSGRQDSPYVR
jgi:hypothetical protein